MNAKTVDQTRVEMSQVMTPNDANFLGKVFGGSILSMIDLVAYATASKFAGNICVTASFDRVDFHIPIEVGDLVSMVGFISYAGRTSVEVTIEIYAENVLNGEKRHTNTARVTMVAIQDGKPTPVPKLICHTREEKLRFLSAKARRELRGRHLAEFDRLMADYATRSDEELDGLMALQVLGV